MPRNIIYPVAILAILGPGGAHGDMRCIKLNAATVCTASTDCYNTSDCRVTCAGVAVDLAGRCSSDSGTENISIADNISLGAGTEQNYCWCAMLRPATSKWVMRYQYHDTAGCIKNCARGCRNGFIFDNVMDTDFRATMYSNLME